jgi:hypothetical protein
MAKKPFYSILLQSCSAIFAGNKQETCNAPKRANDFFQEREKEEQR